MDFHFLKTYFAEIFETNSSYIVHTYSNSTISTPKVTKMFIFIIPVYLRYCHYDNKCWLSLFTRPGQHLGFSNLKILV